MGCLIIGSAGGCTLAQSGTVLLEPLFQAQIQFVTKLAQGRINNNRSLCREMMARMIVRPKQRDMMLMVFIGRLAGSAQPICQERVLYVPYCRTWFHHGSPSPLPVARGLVHWPARHSAGMPRYTCGGRSRAPKLERHYLRAGPRRMRRLQLCTSPRRRTAVIVEILGAINPDELIVPSARSSA